MTIFPTKWRANEQQGGGWAPTSSSQYITMMVVFMKNLWFQGLSDVRALSHLWTVRFFFVFRKCFHQHHATHNLAHRLGDRLIPEQRVFWVVFSGVLHVGPAKSLAFSRGPKGCHDNFKRCGLSWIIIATILTWVTSSPWLVGLFFGDDILPSYIPGLCHKPWNQDPYNHGYSTNPPLTYPPPRNKGLIRPY